MVERHRSESVVRTALFTTLLGTVLAVLLHSAFGRTRKKTHMKGDKRMSAATLTAGGDEEFPAIAMKELRGFPRRVRDMVFELVNTHRMRYRQQDGSHILLYARDKDVPAYKVSASRSEETMVRYLTRWVEVNVPTWGVEPEKASPVAKAPPVSEIGRQLVEKATAKTTKEKEPVMTTAPAAPEIKRNWLVWPKSGRVSQYLYWDGEADHSTIRCVGKNDDGTPCDYTTTSRRGVHLHEAKHTGLSAVYTAKGIEKAVATRAKKRAEAQAEPVDVPLPEPTVVFQEGEAEPPVAPPKARRPKSVAPVAGPTPAEVHAAEALAKMQESIDQQEDREMIERLASRLGIGFSSVVEVNALREEIARLTHENEDLHAKLALIREATGL